MIPMAKHSPIPMRALELESASSIPLSRAGWLPLCKRRQWKPVHRRPGLHVERFGVKTGIQLDKLIEAGNWICSQLGDCIQIKSGRSKSKMDCLKRKKHMNSAPHGPQTRQPKTKTKMQDFKNFPTRKG